MTLRRNLLDHERNLQTPLRGSEQNFKKLIWQELVPAEPSAGGGIFSSDAIAITVTLTMSSLNVIAIALFLIHISNLGSKKPPVARSSQLPASNSVERVESPSFTVVGGINRKKNWKNYPLEIFQLLMGDRCIPC